MSNPLLAGISVQNASFHFDKLYDYVVPAAYETSLLPGCRVLVPFGRGGQVRQGIVWSLHRAPEPECNTSYKEIAAVLDAEPLADPHMMKLAEYMKAHTFCTLFDAVKTMVPAGINRKTNVYFCVPETPPENAAGEPDADSLEGKILQYLRARKGAVKKQVLLTDFGLSAESDLPDRMAKDGLLLREVGADRPVGDATIRMVRMADGLDTEEALEELADKRTPKQDAVLTELLRIGTCSVKELCYFTGVTEAVIKNLEKKGLVTFYEKETFRRPYDLKQTDTDPIDLTPEQQAAFNGLSADLREGGKTALLFGVTGSGKTQVYLRLIDEVLPTGRGVIVMVPEISLTPQTLKLFYARYGEKVAVFHSALSAGERLDEWKRVKNGDARIAVGTRSAVFAPFERLGLVIMDEEQEETYQSDMTPRYHARDIARFRCTEDQALLLLASATPSLESYALAEAGQYAFYRLSERYGEANLPEVIVTDMREEGSAGTRTILGRRLLQSLTENLQNGHQSILLMNRRGYNTYAACNACGAVVTCPQCSISLTYHRANNRLMCHYCGYSVPFTRHCSECGAEDVRYSGLGTQKVEEELGQLFPEARILRMDADSTMHKYAYDEKLAAFRKGEADILLGTQMVAKGLDFENVTLVGVLSADRELYNDDYKSMERTFDLLTQVVGRSGRGRFPGQAIIQTINPENDVIRFASNQDYESFYRREITLRKMLTYPPYCSLFSVRFRGTDPERVRKASVRFMELLKQTASEGEHNGVKVIVLGPMPERVFKVSGQYRFRLVLKCHNNSRFRNMMADLLRDFGKSRENAGISVVVKPER